MLFNSLYKLTLCLLRRICKNDRINAPIAGFISALSIAFDAKKRRTLFAVLTMSRMFETCCNAVPQVKEIKNKEIYLWSICCTYLMFTYSVEQDIINNGIGKYFKILS